MEGGSDKKHDAKTPEEVLAEADISAREQATGD
jgi:hypothetical protein